MDGSQLDDNDDEEKKSSKEPTPEPRSGRRRAEKTKNSLPDIKRQPSKRSKQEVKYVDELDDGEFALEDE